MPLMPKSKSSSCPNLLILTSKSPRRFFLKLHRRLRKDRRPQKKLLLLPIKSDLTLSEPRWRKRRLRSLQKKKPRERHLCSRKPKKRRLRLQKLPFRRSTPKLKRRWRRQKKQKKRLKFRKSERKWNRRSKREWPKNSKSMRSVNKKQNRNV